MDLEGSGWLLCAEQAAGSVGGPSVVLLANCALQSECERCRVPGMAREPFFLGIKAPGTMFSL